MVYNVYMVNKSWVLKVPEELNKEAFEAAHKLRISKSEFIREAVKEKIHPIINSTPIQQTPEKEPQATVTHLISRDSSPFKPAFRKTICKKHKNYNCGCKE